MKAVRFGLIGCGLMGREFASAVARWCHLPNLDIKPEIVAVCNTTLQRTDAEGAMVPCETWDNATLLCDVLEFGFSDAILQMWAAFLYELEHGAPLRQFAGCATPEETALSHRLFTAAVDSHQNARVVRVAS